MNQPHPPAISLTNRIASLFSTIPEVVAIALGGSQASGLTDATSDIDLYIYTRAEIPLATRQAFVEQSGGASIASLGLTFWGPGDEWFDAATGIEVDLVYFDACWIEAQIQRVIGEYQASLGYTTCLWYTCRNSKILYDPHGWFQTLQTQSQQAYPEPLRRNIIALNHPVLRDVIPAYYNQLAKAVKRGDSISINHRLAALFASYFDILFAVNRVLHPGEKRIVSFALSHCEKLPADMSTDIEAVFESSATAGQKFLQHLTRLLDHLDEFLNQAGF